MKNKVLLISFLVKLFVLSSCSIPDAPPEIAQALNGKVTSVTLTSYTSSTATVVLQGELPSDSAAPLSTIKLYTNSQCVGVAAGEGLANTFANSGITAVVPISGVSNIYGRSNIDSQCYFLTEYIFAPGQVPSPQFSRTDPVSPNFDSYRPYIYGSAVSGSIVTFYSDSGCTTAVGSGTAEVFNVNGLRLNLPQNQTTTIYADAADIFARKSSCAQLTNYTHTISLVSAPTFNQIIPTSPSNVTSSPVVRGVVPSGTTSVRLYSDAGCSVKLAEGTPNDFYINGLKINVAPNVNTTIYAKSIDTNANASACMFLTNYFYDTIAPGEPSFISSVPVAPTRLTLYPKLFGSSPSDTTRVKIFNSSNCANLIGNGTKAEFELTGLSAALTPNTITSIYAQAFDAAGNASTCKFFLNYKHNTIPPDLPVLNSTDPISPNNITPNPYLNGNASVTTTKLHFYSDELCTNSIGSGTGDAFNNAGIQVFTPNVPNSVNITTFFVQAEDEEGNLSECSGLGTYGYSTAKARTPSFTQAFPISPSRSSVKPVIFGAASASVSIVQLHSNATCNSLLGSANRAAFATQGIQLTVPANASTDIYASSVDVYGNSSDCVYFTNFINDNIPPQAPSFLTTNPISPNNTSNSPLFSGNVITNIAGKPLTTNRIIFYDSMLCLTQISLGLPSEYVTSGISVLVPDNTITSVYAVAGDAAGNRSSCTFLTNYTYSTNPPGHPLLSSSTPGTPSYSKFFNLKGTLAPSGDIVSASTVALYKDTSCTTVLATGTVSQYVGPGIAAIGDVNAVTTVYGQTTDIVGTKSSCRSLINFSHSNLGPTGMQADMNIDGSVSLTWQSDQVANPTPNYVVKRSTKPGGPYTIISAQNTGNAFRDVSVINGQTYYYVVAATNSTGTSYDSNEATITVNGPGAKAPIGLVVLPGDGVAYLSWTLTSENLNYKIYRSTQSGGPYTMLTSLVGSSFNDQGLNNDQDYYYVVSGVNANGESVQSTEVGVMPRVAPPAPQNLKLTLRTADPNCSGNNSVTLTWTPSPYYDNYIIRRGNVIANMVDYGSTTANTFRDCGPIVTQQGGSTYVGSVYGVISTWGKTPTIVRSPLSNVVYMFTGAGAPVPTGNAGNNQVSITWNPMPSAESYQVWRSNSPGWPSQNYTQLHSAFISNVYVDNSVTNDTSYFYVIVPNYPTASGFPSKEVSALPKPNPTNPSNLTLRIDPLTKLPILDWKPSNYANSYTIYRSVGGGAYSPMATVLKNNFTDSLSTPGLYSYYVTGNWATYETAATNAVSVQYGTLLANPTVAATASNISLSWGSVSTAVSYRIHRSINYNGPFTHIGTTSSTTFVNSTTLPSSYPAVVNQGYFYTVQPVFAGSALGQNSSIVSGMLTGVNVVSGLSVVGATATSVSLTWTKLNPTAAKIYYVYRSLSASGTYTRFPTSSNINEYVASSNLNSDTVYYFKVADSSCSTSCLSAAVSAITVDSPLAPTLKGGNGSVQITGIGVGATSYEFLRSTDAVNFSVIATGQPTASYVDNTAVNGTLYYYKMSAVYSNGTNQTSPMTEGVVPGITPLPPDQIFVTDNSAGTTVDLTWSAVGGATDYVVYYGNTSGGPYTFSQISTLNSTSIFGLTQDADYYFIVKARLGVIESNPSAEINIRPSVSPSAPALAVQNNAVSITWSAVAGASTYDVLRSTDNLNFNSIISGTSATTLVDNLVVSDTTYYYQFLPKLPNNSALAISAVAGPVTIDAPLAPTSLAAESASGTSVKLSWTPSSSSSTSGYRIYRSTTSGSGYTLIQTTGSSMITYLDISVTLSQNYYYVVRAINASGRESSPTNEASVSLLNGPALSLSQTNGVVNISWASVPGISSYKLYRSKVSGGPYGLIYSGTSLSYIDNNAENGIVYFYVVSGIYSNNEKSIYSPENNILVSKTINLKFPVELIDLGLASDTSPVTFERSRTSIDTNAYDGVVSYQLEVVATNIDSVATTVSLVDEADNVVGQFNVPANSTSPMRLSGSITPVAGFHTYRLRLGATANASDLQVFSGKIWIQQTNATRTKIYFPLTAPMNSSFNGDMFSPTESTTNLNLTLMNNSDEFIRDTSNLVKIPDYAGWEFESVVSTYGSRGLISLFNTTTGQSVKSTETVFEDTEVTLFNTTFDEGTSEFGVINELNKYKVAIRCYLDCELGGVNVYKAGLWVKLENITKAEILIRQSTFLNNISVLAQNDRFRTALDLSVFSNPSAYFRAYAKASSMGDNGNVEVVSNGSGVLADTGFANLSLVSNSSISFNESNYTTKQTASPVTLNNQDRFMTQISPSMGGLDIRSSYIVIRASP